MIRNIILGIVIGALATFSVLTFTPVGAGSDVPVYCDGYSQGVVDATATFVGPPPLDWPGPTNLHAKCVENPQSPMGDMVRGVVPQYTEVPS